MGRALLIIALLIVALWVLAFYANRNAPSPAEGLPPEEPLPQNGTSTPSETPAVSTVNVALLQTEFTGEPERGCDRVVMVARSIPTTTAPLSAALRELYSIEETNVNNNYNFIANTNETLSFDRAEVRNGTAHIYLEGRLSGLAGVCDNPRAQIQIEETALQFPTVQNVQLYLNGSPATLTPSEQ